MKITTTQRLQYAGLLQTIDRNKPKAAVWQFLFTLLCLITLVGFQGWAQTNNALDFDGTGDYVDVPDNAILDFNSQAFTLELWAKNAGAGTQILVSKRNGGQGYDLVHDGTNFVFTVQDGSANTVQLSHNATFQTSWTHIAASYDPTTGTDNIKLYINGVEVAKASDNSAGDLSNAFAFRMGTNEGVASEFQGQIDEARVWNDIRTQKEISLNMNNPVAGNEANLVAYYPLNEGIANGNNTALTTVFDATTNNLNGTLNGFAKTGTTSNFVAGFTAVNSALDFDGGSDYVEVADNASLDFNNQAFTIELWAKNAGAGTQTLISKRNTGQGYDLIHDGTNFIFTVDNGGGGTATVTHTAAFPATWTHIAASYDPATGTVIIYINGEAGTTATGTTLLDASNAETLRLGANGATGNFFTGQIDEVRIWNVTRTCAQIKETKDVELKGNETGLVTYYNFNYGTAGGTNTGITTLPDLSTNTNNGTLNTFALSGATSNWVDGSGNNVSGNSPNLQPEINVKANGNDVLTGSTTINTTLNTFFPFTAIGSNVSQTFTLQNTGTGTLTMSSVTSSDANFTVSTLSNLTGGNNTTFTITYAPTMSGMHTSTITINSNDCDEAAYTFQVRGTGASGNTNALDFDGVDDHVTASLDGTGLTNVTVEMWLNPGVLGTNNILHWNNALAGASPFIDFKDASGTLNVNVNGGDNLSTTILAGQWVHIALVHDGTDWRLYKNGQLAGTYTGGTANIANATALFMAGGATGNYDGLIDEVRVWNDVRTQDEIVAQMNNELVGTEANLVAYYNFNQGTAGGNNTTELTVLDASLNGNNSADISTTGFETGTPSTSLNEGTTSNYVAGFTKINNALSFNGTTDYVATGLNLPAGDFTMEAWIQYEGTTGANFQPIIASVNQQFFIGKNNGNTEFGIQDGDYKTNANSNNAFDGNWHHVAVTRSGTTISVYVDGSFAYADTFTGAAASALNIGHEPEGGGYFFTGKIDEVRIWSTVRTCAEINAYKGVELTGTETGLVAYYNFNHGTAAGNNTGLTTLPDISTNNNTGTLTNFAGLDGSVNSGQTSNWVDGSGNNVSGTTPANQPEVNVQGGSPLTTITDGDGVPDAGDNTEFGSVYVGTGKTVTYTIQNTGAATLNITSIILAGSTDYTLGTLSFPISVASGSSTTFEVTFAPSAATADIGTTVTINNSDCDEGVYDFAIKGTGLQAAPGGVTTNLTFWVKADVGVTVNIADVTEWADQSGNGLHLDAVVGTPTLTDASNGLNFNPVVNFSGNTNRLLRASVAGLSLRTNTTVSTYGVYNTNSAEGLVFEHGFGTAERFTLKTQNQVWNNESLITAPSPITTTPSIGTFIVNVPNATFYTNGAANGTTSSHTAATDDTQTLYVGSRANNSLGLDGDLGELIMYSSAHSATNQQKIESYLGLKYGITKAGDYLASDGTTKMWDATVGAAYLNNIAGIGRDDASALNQKQSKSINSGAALTIGVGTVASDNLNNTNIFSADKQFMVWGHNNGLTDYTANKVDAGVPNAGVDGRIPRVWQIQDGGVGATQVKFDISQFSNFTATTAGEFALLIDDDGTDFSNATIVIANEFASNVVTFNNIDFGGTTKYISLGQWKGATTSAEKGTYLSCNGTNHYVSTASLVTNANTNFTVEMWFQWDGAGAGDRTLFYNGATGSSNGYGLVFDGTHVVPRINGAKVSNTTTTIVANTWYHVALVGDGANLKLYVNGKEEILGSTALPAVPTTGTFIGSDNGAGNYFSGKIEEVRFWNVTRTETQLREYMHLTLEGSENGIVAYYQFNANSGNAIDAIGGNNGTLQNGVTRTTSDCPVGKGRSVTNNITTSGNQVFANTGVAINFAAGVLPQGDVVVTQLDGVDTPTNVPTDVTTYPSAYWIVRNYGANSSFTQLAQIEFTIPGGNTVSVADQTNPSNIGLYKRASSAGSSDPWVFMGGATTANASTGVITFTAFSPAFTAFSQVMPATVNGGTSGLPVTLSSFDAVREDNQRVLVRWQTLSEHNNAGFEVQKSENGIDFKILGFVDGAGNSNEKRNYQFTDVQANRSAYYRLKQLDNDGKFSYSPVKFVQGVDLQTLRVYPNPFTNELTLDFGGKSTTQLPVYVALYTAQGKRILQHRGKINEVQTAINQGIASLQQGMYVLRVMVGNKVYIKRIMKQ
ncbi:LamG-like jellyroll fold domain-containing protein [uncultured Microscilla sp.]|uniref:LamG-like jellyroll fold domain-containing protein n=1 Tax=uncultured Microscilla sp. TaxID=432653 RepID=UPI0026076298|nr:LamG-like jellyroll fold domain-containing protein [uncultured Microscilla sp.]